MLKIGEVAKIAMRVSAFGPAYTAIEAISELVQKSSAVDLTNGSVEEVEAYARRQQVEMKLAEAQAKVAQELAIADRIANAIEVEIEEFFEFNGSGKAGVTAKEGELLIGAAGGVGRVTKRVIRFSGFANAQSSQVVQSIDASMAVKSSGDGA